MARNRQRARDRKARQGNIHHEDVSGELEHASGEVEEFDASLIQGADGEASFAAESIRHRIKAVIDAENPRAILSDDAIVEMLQGDGIDIARRTVAKYREQLGIASSVQRRREKNLRRG